MTDKLFCTLFAAALTSAERDAFVSDWSLSSVWGDAPDADIPAVRIDLLARLWDAAHLTIRDIRQHTGLSQAAFATRYCIPTRTLEDWERGVRSCPDYLRLLLAQATGEYQRPWKKPVVISLSKAVFIERKTVRKAGRLLRSIGRTASRKPL